jgi:hypothetical protein
MSDWHDRRDEAIMDEAYSDYFEEKSPEADELVKRYGARAVEMVPNVRFGEEPEDIEPDEFLESLVADRVQELRADPLRHAPPSRVRAPQLRRGPRRRGAGRPPARRTSSRSSARGNPDLAGDEPPGHRPPLREAAA